MGHSPKLLSAGIFTLYMPSSHAALSRTRGKRHMRSRSSCGVAHVADAVLEAGGGCSHAAGNTLAEAVSARSSSPRNGHEQLDYV